MRFLLRLLMVYIVCGCEAAELEQPTDLNYTKQEEPISDIPEGSNILEQSTVLNLNETLEEPIVSELRIHMHRHHSHHHPHHHHPHHHHSHHHPHHHHHHKLHYHPHHIHIPHYHPSHYHYPHYSNHHIHYPITSCYQCESCGDLSQSTYEKEPCGLGIEKPACQKGVKGQYVVRRCVEKSSCPRFNGKQEDKKNTAGIFDNVKNYLDKDADEYVYCCDDYNDCNSGSSLLQGFFLLLLPILSGWLALQLLK